MLPIVSTILGIATKFIPDKDKQIELQKMLIEKETELEKAFVSYADKDHELRLKELEHRGFKSWWRPFLMFGFGTIVMLYCMIYYILPGIMVYFPQFEFALLMEPIQVDPALWDLVKYSILGIGGMRTVDKYNRRK